MGREDSAAIANNDDQQQQQPLLPSNTDCSDQSEKKKKKKRVLSIWVKWVLEISIWVVFISWILLILLFPVEWFSDVYEAWIKAGGGTVFGITGRVLLVYSAPIVVVSVLARARQIIVDSQTEEERLDLKKRPGLRLGTLPVVVDGLFGIVSAAELVGIIAFIVFLIWSLIMFSIKNIDESDGVRFVLIEVYGVCFANLGSFALVLMFLFVTRGSALLRLINVPFEHAVRYHVWLGHIAMIFFTLHGFAIALAYATNGTLVEIFYWVDDNVASLAGVIALLIGFAIWITSMPQIREKYFESFYYTHQLYVLFLLFFALHAGGFFFAMVPGTIFLFGMDRFLRFWQSQRTVDIVSTKFHPCGVVELALAKPANLKYNALSFIFLRIREVSLLQWHPFSLASSPLDGEDHVSVMIKAQGEWTTKLKDKVLTLLGSGQHCKLTASVEGPYGYELPYYITYSNLVLVAGGVGISPFVAILNDILCRIREGRPCATKNILIVWAIKKSNELPLLSKVNIADKLISIQTRIYVTQESGPQLEEGDNCNPNYNEHDSSATNRTISTLVGTGNSKWLAIYALLCAIGFVITKALFDIFFVIPLGELYWWFKGFLLFATLVVAVIVFGGPVLGLWHLREAKRVVSGECENGSGARNGHRPEGYLWKEDNTSIWYGSRPDLVAIFESVNETLGHVDVGVMVCGPSSLESRVAAQCRTLNFRRNSKCNDQPIFHFHSHSFSF